MGDEPGTAETGATDGAHPAEFVRTDEGNGPVLVARGEIDVYTSPDFRRELQNLVAGAEQRVIVDFRAVDFIDSSGLGVLVGALKRARERGAVIVLRGMSPATQKVFDITGLTQLFELEP
jgi:anti-sigma B factor antagonist